MAMANLPNTVNKLSLADLAMASMAF